MTDDLYTLTQDDAHKIAMYGQLPTNGENGGQPEADRDSWQPINLATLPDTLPIRPTLGGVGIVYPGKRHVFSGPPESAKTLAAYAIGIETIRAGGSIILIDFEMGGYDARARLNELGATTNELARIHYLEPDEPATQQRIDQLIRLQTQLVIIDAAAGAYSLEGLDDNKRGDVEKLATLYVRSFWRAGVASIFIDHVVKNTETRGKFAIGSERKLGGADVHLGFETLTAIQRGTTGLYKITTHKDRGGYLKRGHLANLELCSDTSHAITWGFAAPADDTAPAGYFRPTHLMEKVSIILETTPDALTRNDVYSRLGGTKQYVLAAITALVIEGFATETDGPGRSKPVILARRYRENDPACNPENDPSGSVVRGGSTAVREPDDASGSSGSPPLRGRHLRPPSSNPPENDEWFGRGSWLDELAATVDLDQPTDPPDDPR